MHKKILTETRRGIVIHGGRARDLESPEATTVICRHVQKHSHALTLSLDRTPAPSLFTHLHPHTRQSITDSLAHSITSSLLHCQTPSFRHSQKPGKETVCQILGLILGLGLGLRLGRKLGLGMRLGQILIFI